MGKGNRIVDTFIEANEKPQAEGYHRDEDTVRRKLRDEQIAMVRVAFFHFFSVPHFTLGVI